MFEFTDGFLEILNSRGLTLEEIQHVLDYPESRWVENRGDASTGVAGLTPDGKCLYIPLATGDTEESPFRPITVFVVEQPRVLLNDTDLRRERWERRKGRKD